MRFFAAIEALLVVAVRLIEMWNAKKKREAERDLQNDVQDIERDPVDYAQREYGGVPAEPDAPAVPGDKAERVEIRKDG